MWTIIKYILYGAGILFLVNLIFHWFSIVLSRHIIGEFERRMIAKVGKPQIINPNTGKPDTELEKKYLKKRK
jgi:hypothetical protein